ncbi:MAG: phasin family protein [Rhizobium sp.]|nr:phasin family protein [Rhizobium sp.]
MFKFDETSLYGKDAMDKALKSYSSTSKGLQAIAAETSDYAKKSFEANVSHFQTLMGVKSFESVIELQTSYAKAALEGYMTEMSKLGEMYSDLAKEAYKPAEQAVAAATEVVKSKVEKASTAASVAA